MTLVRSISMFTLVPVRARVELAPREGISALLWLPVVGAALGAIAALPATAIRQWAPHAGLLGAVLAIALLAAFTRCLHLDGVADTADGLGSRAPAERAREIMRQSDIGPFGVVTLVVVLALDIGALDVLRAGVWGPVGALAVAAATGRVAAVHAALRGVKPAHDSGFGVLVADGVAPIVGMVWTVAVLGFGAVIAVALSVPVLWFLVPQAVALAVAFALRVHARRRIGGVTGDIFGALIETATAITLIGMALR